MADVSLPMDGSSDRAQLLLVGALTLAVVFLSLSLLLNSVIYTENLATRQTNTDVEKATTFRFVAVDVLGDAIEHVNRGDASDFGTRRDDYRNVTGVAIRTLGNQSATDSLATDVERRTVSRGTRIADDNATSTLTPENDSRGNWTVVTDARVRNARLHVETDDVVRIVVDDGTARDVVLDGTANELRVEGESEACSLGGGRNWVDLTAARVDGERCRPLTTLPFDDEVNVSIANGTDATGTYSLVVDRYEAGIRSAVDTQNYPGQCAPPSPPTYNDSDAGGPYTSPAVYAATANVSVASPDIDYRRTVRTAPGEVGGPPTDPTFERYDVTNTSTSLRVNWNVTDPNGDFDYVAVGLYNVSDGSTEVSPSNYTTSDGDVTFTGLSNSTAYAINATAVDGATPENRRTVSEIHSPDGGGGCPP
ncbi:fibronectin type III domain-containing protein [Haloplanus salinarum]|uniref:fibronectin type III domain-containing protein n=1 Tax=Haloplanus salinarum TaxID=1912324 RepID=UPI00214AEDEA|nr:fibronectin type III domain-containing protein [Haloplanus salinarum]